MMNSREKRNLLTRETSWSFERSFILSLKGGCVTRLFQSRMTFFSLFEERALYQCGRERKKWFCFFCVSSTLVWHLPYISTRPRMRGIHAISVFFFSLSDLRMEWKTGAKSNFGDFFPTLFSESILHQTNKRHICAFGDNFVRLSLTYFPWLPNFTTWTFLPSLEH